MISVKTGMLGVIGNPLGHSMSPAMQNAALKELGLNYIYLPLEVPSEKLFEAVSGLKALNFKGFNVTIPHKRKMIDRLDWLSPAVEKIGAVNTVCIENGILKGYNTDADGFIRSLWKDGMFDPNAKKVLLIGAGGAARAVAFGLSEAGAGKLYIVNRSIEKASKLAGEIDLEGCPSEVLTYGSIQFEKLFEEMDLVVQTTSLGMSPRTDTLPDIPVEKFHSGQVVYDLVYNPLETRFLAEARKRGAKPVSGLGMLVHQGALALELWTGKKAPVNIMKKVAERELERQQ